ncbi:iron ABC transporter permease [Chitiniphilus purpureus]|uniref:Iron ABC transporter permease n=1 Tax=Chitiniphilus purpureus TaxID=2981137 RepID=A0ABY6DHT3_9NEIS|nr:iron ABC transporter permease [Chitiniphilus sp. CD1]UXY13910.1 iron ABC transporter permease [Chitiniphilus sp. CD1]
MSTATPAARLTRRRQVFTLLLLALLLLAMAVASLCLGSTSYRPWQLWAEGSEAMLARDVVLTLRLPRTLAALAVGGLLALAGTLLQILLRNPLADPYVLGTSGGASVGALSAMLAGTTAAVVSLSAAAGAWCSTVLLFLLAWRDRSASQARLLLTGVALASFCGAFSSLLLALAPNDSLLRGMVFWMLGDLTGASWQLALPALGVLLLLVWPLARSLNVLGQGAQVAHALGTRGRELRWLLYFVAAAATAAAVTTGGMIGFVGLIVPHALRLMLGQDQRLLLPAAALGGGIVLLAADLIARAALAPQQLPVGVVTALAGVPVFLWLLQRQAGRA